MKPDLCVLIEAAAISGTISTWEVYPEKLGTDEGKRQIGTEAASVATASKLAVTAIQEGDYPKICAALDKVAHTLAFLRVLPTLELAQRKGLIPDVSRLQQAAANIGGYFTPEKQELRSLSLYESERPRLASVMRDLSATAILLNLSCPSEDSHGTISFNDNIKALQEVVLHLDQPSEMPNPVEAQKIKQNLEVTSTMMRM